MASVKITRKSKAPAKPKKIIKVPFNSGQMVRRANRFPFSALSYVDSYIFDDVIQFSKIGRTTSSNYAIFESKTTNKVFYMFMKDFEHMLKSQVLKLGIISGQFTFVQRGSSFGIKILSVSRLEALV